MFSCRITKSCRTILYKEERSDNYHLLLVDHNHDDAYDNVENLKLHFNSNKKYVPLINALQYQNINLAEVKGNKLFSNISSKNLVNLGVPFDKIKLVKEIPNIISFNEIKEKNILPKEAIENLEFLIFKIYVDELLIHVNNSIKKTRAFIEEKILAPAINHADLEPDFKASIEDTQRRFKKLNTAYEIRTFFNSALDSKRGKEMYRALSRHNLTTFEDIKDEVNRMLAM
jgi:hypothetical protein